MSNSGNKISQSIFSVFFSVYALPLGVLGNVSFTSAKQVGNQWKSAFVYGICPAHLACKKQCSRHFQSMLYLSFVQNILLTREDKGAP